MNVIIYNKITKEKKEDHYPRIDISEPIEGLDPNIEIYFIKENLIENPNPDKYFTTYTDVLTKNLHTTYTHIKLANRNYSLVEKNTPEIIQKLNDELASYLDTNCPEWERIKLLSRISLNTKQNEHQYYKAVLQWLDDCRTERDIRENSYLTNNQFPKFNEWPVKPAKPQK
jgi:hypothetical protein